MARQISKRPPGRSSREMTVTPSLGYIVTPPAVPSKRAATRPSTQERTIEDRLAAKAKIADTMDFTGQPSLGQMTRAERRKLLFGV
jgi:hypothetical protein